MSQRSLFQRIFSVEVIVGALAGAGAPYGVGLAAKVALTRVPLWLVVLCVGGGALLGWLCVRAVQACRQKIREARDRKRRELREELHRALHHGFQSHIGHGLPVANLVPTPRPRSLKGSFESVAMTAVDDEQLLSTDEIWSASLA